MKLSFVFPCTSPQLGLLVIAKTIELTTMLPAGSSVTQLGLP